MQQSCLRVLAGTQQVSNGEGIAYIILRAIQKDFLRICVAQRQGYTVQGIRHLTGLSKRVVEKHLAHYAELGVSPSWQEPLERKLRFYKASIDAELAQKRGLA